MSANIRNINYNNRRFVSVSNTENGEVSDDIIFEYKQEEDIVSSIYRGGAIKYGMLIAKVDKDGCLDMRYQQINAEGKLRTGKCFSTPEVLPDGRIRLHEKWEWTSGDFSKGESVIEEIAG